MLKFNKGPQTSYQDDLNVIWVRGDVNPLPESVSGHPRSTMTSRAVLGHELGHASRRGTRLSVEAWNDEFRASYWAAKNLPGPSVQERADLVRDALEQGGRVWCCNQEQRLHQKDALWLLSMLERNESERSIT